MDNEPQAPGRCYLLQVNQHFLETENETGAGAAFSESHILLPIWREDSGSAWNPKLPQENMCMSVAFCQDKISFPASISCERCRQQLRRIRSHSVQVGTFCQWIHFHFTHPFNKLFIDPLLRLELRLRVSRGRVCSSLPALKVFAVVCGTDVQIASVQFHGNCLWSRGRACSSSVDRWAWAQDGKRALYWELAGWPGFSQVSCLKKAFLVREQHGYPLGREKHNLKVENYWFFSFCCCCFLNYYSYFLSFKNLFFNFWPPHGMQGIEPALSGVEVRSLNCWTTREVWGLCFIWQTYWGLEPGRQPLR